MRANGLQEFDRTMSRWFTPAVKWVVYLTAIGFVASLLAGPGFAAWFGASVMTTIWRFRFYQVVTFPFASVGLLNVLFGLLTLWMFAARLEMRWGTRRFTRFFILVTAGTLVSHFVVTGIMGGVFLGVPLFGLSGILFGILGAYAFYWPDDRILLYGVFPMKVKHCVWILGILLFATLPYPGSQAGRLTQFGGLATALLFVWLPGRVNWPGLRRKPKKTSRFRDL